MNFTPFPELSSQRLVLRNIQEPDWETVLYLRSDETINKFIERPEDRKTRNESDAKKFIEELHQNLENNKSIAWGISLKDEPKIIGSICLWNFSSDKKTAEVGYDLNPEFQGKGIMSEALNLVIAYGFKKLHLVKIEAFTHQKNESSKKLLEKNGFKLMKNRKDADNANNLIYELTKISF